MNGSQRVRQPGTGSRTKAPPINHTLYVTLEELYTGTTKRMRITSKRIVDSAGSTQQVAAEKEIVVKAGWKNGTKITFENEGDEAPGVIPADVVFTLQTKPHDRFERDGDDLIYTVSDILIYLPPANTIHLRWIHFWGLHHCHFPLNSASSELP
jgi:DnaJ-class molecular chaperone